MNVYLLALMVGAVIYGVSIWAALVLLYERITGRTDQ